MVAIGIMSILGLGAWSAVSTSIRMAGRINDRVLESVRLLQLDDRLRGLAFRIRPPYWASKQSVETEGGTLRAAFLDGDPEKSMSISFEDGVLSIDDGEYSSRYSDFKSAEFSPAVNDSKVTYGVTVDLQAKSGDKISITARFGGTPIGSMSDK